MSDASEARLATVIELAKGLAEIGQEMRKRANEMAQAGDSTAVFANNAATLALLSAASMLDAKAKAVPVALLASIMAQLGSRYKEKTPGEVQDLLVSMMVGSGRRVLLMGSAEWAIDRWLGSGGSEVAPTAADVEAPDGPDLGECIGGFEPPTGDEVELEPLSCLRADGGAPTP